VEETIAGDRVIRLFASVLMRWSADAVEHALLFRQLATVESAKHIATRNYADHTATLTDGQTTHTPLLHQVHYRLEVRFAFDEERAGIHDVGDVRIVQVDPVPQCENQVKVADDADGVAIGIYNGQTSEAPVHEQIRGSSRRLFWIDDND
jgi:hypothetical protein